MKYYKYIHLFGFNELKFSTNLVKFFADQQNGIDPKEHHFVTPYYQVYEELKSYGNIELVSQSSDGREYGGKLINEVAPYCQFLFIHGACPVSEMLKIKRKYFSKIVWRTWGSDAGYRYKSGDFFRNLIKYILNNMVWKPMIKKFALVGIANTVDEIDLTDRFGSIHMLRMPYPRDNKFEITSRIKQEMKKTSNITNVIVGHSGFANDNHIQILDLLSKYKDENIRIFLPLSYGGKEYIQNVKEYAIRNLGDKIQIIDTFLDYEDYARLISQMDVGIFDGTGSYALGNISLLLFFDKKIFLNRNGVIKKAFDYEKVPCCLTEQISKMTFEEFSESISYEAVNKNNLTIKPYSCSIERWHNILEYLDSLNN